MDFIDEMFDPAYAFDHDRKQRRDIEALREEVMSSAGRAEVDLLRQQVNQLQLLTRALATLVETKGIASKEELEVLVQQIDLLDGVEDGKMSDQVWNAAARCDHCQHFLNPKRERCIYCGRGQTAGGANGPYRGGPSAKRDAPRMARCAACEAQVPQGETFFTDQGELWCTLCVNGR